LSGGVYFAESLDEVADYTSAMIGKRMTFSENIRKLHDCHMDRGWICNCVLVQEQLDVEREFYVSIDYDRGDPVITYSSHGGMSLENIEKRYPDSLHKIYVDPLKCLDLKTLLKVANDLGIQDKQSSLVFLIKNLWECFR
jgi:succinyl-CoA synthetase beta subunit